MRAPGRRIHPLVPLAAATLGVAVIWWSRLRFWFPLDEGTLGQAARRVLEGQVPHREFLHPWTGADALLHAGFLRVFGMSLAAIRDGFALVTTLWYLALWGWLWRRRGAATATVFALVLGAWGVPMYAGAMPSWYVTFCVAAAVAVLAVGSGRPSPGRIVVAGGLLGLGIAFKVTALFAVVGVALWLIAQGDEREPASAWGIMLVVLALVAAPLLIGSSLSARRFLHLLVPTIAMTAWVLVREVRRARARGVTFDPRAMAGPLRLAAGIALGLAPIALWLGFAGALPGFFRELHGVGTLRAEFATMPLPAVSSLGYGVLVLAAVGVTVWRPDARLGFLLLPWLLVVVLAWLDYRWHRGLWLGLRGAIPFAMVIIAVGASRARTAVDQGWLLVATVFGWMTLTQFPFGPPVYFVFLVPIGLIAMADADRLVPRLRPVLGAIAVTLAAFSYLEVVPSSPRALGWAREPSERLARVPGSHGGLFVVARDSIRYGWLLRVLADSVPPGPIWAGPDIPEVAFLSGRIDRNRTPMQFLEEPQATRLPSFDGLAGLVIQRRPLYSVPVDSAMLAAARETFPRAALVGNFTVLWR